MSIEGDLIFELDRIDTFIRAVENDLDVLLAQEIITARTRERLDVNLDKAKGHNRSALEIIENA